MNKFSARYDRNILLFGEEGQKKLQETSVIIIGVGGLGCAVVQQLALLGVGHITLVDDEELDETNRNRFIGARNDDPVPGSKKVDLGTRLVNEINPDVSTTKYDCSLVNIKTFDAVNNSDWVIGCFDHDGPRSILNELCKVYAKPYIDLASDVPESGVYGGRICISFDESGCLHCLGEIDDNDVRRYLMTEEEQRHEDKIYGISRDVLGEAGPSVVTINSVVASLAATEFMVAVTEMRQPNRLIKYLGHQSKVIINKDIPRPDCYYCKGIRQSPKMADIERYLDIPHLR